MKYWISLSSWSMYNLIVENEYDLRWAITTCIKIENCKYTKNCRVNILKKLCKHTIYNNFFLSITSWFDLIASCLIKLIMQFISRNLLSIIMVNMPLLQVWHVVLDRKLMKEQSIARVYQNIITGLYYNPKKKVINNIT